MESSPQSEALGGPGALRHLPSGEGWHRGEVGVAAAVAQQGLDLGHAVAFLQGTYRGFLLNGSEDDGMMG